VNALPSCRSANVTLCPLCVAMVICFAGIEIVKSMM